MRLRRFLASLVSLASFASRVSRVSLFLLACVLLSAALVGACKRKGDAVAEAVVETPVVSDKSEGLQLTWIDEKGEFHTEQRAPDVPLVGRDVVRVRVLDPAHDLPGGDQVFVADLRLAKPDGNYPVRSVPRAEFEDVAVARRTKSGTAVLTPKAAPGLGAGAAAGGGANGAPAGSGSAGNAGAGNSGAGNSGAGNGGVDRPSVIIYGASWCGPCHQAAAYLKTRGVDFVEHDIEQDGSAAREMQSKLAKAGVRGGSIPVLDVRGHILVGFDARAVDQALGQAL